MLNILLGLILIFLGVWGLMVNWWAFLDLVYVLVPVFFTGFGAVAIIAGITGFHNKRKELPSG